MLGFELYFRSFYCFILWYLVEYILSSTSAMLPVPLAVPQQQSLTAQPPYLTAGKVFALFQSTSGLCRYLTALCGCWLQPYANTPDFAESSCSLSAVKEGGWFAVMTNLLAVFSSWPPQFPSTAFFFLIFYSVVTASRKLFFCNVGISNSHFQSYTAS